ncbi:MAG: cysteine desulfurase-like protein [Saprospiraceae bacterium]|nr:cysteine desulfurase-like protein [Saprospiraceae bacterium]
MDIERIRSHFPALSRKVNNHSVIYLDGPAGTQVPMQVIDAISAYYKTSNANSHGHFTSSQETDVILDRTRTKVATMLNAAGPDCISFGQNMTTLNFSLSKAIMRTLQAGDEIFITQLDHESNRGPWLTLRENGIVVQEIKLLTNGELDYADFGSRISSKTKLVCLGYASNILGTVNDVEQVTKAAHDVGAKVLVDAVHYAPHFSIDVNALDCDFLLCSAYKFYGPHVGLLYCKRGLLDSLRPDCLRTQDQRAPYKIETGTLNHAAIAGVEAAIDYLASLGAGDNLRDQIIHALSVSHKHEITLARTLAAALSSIPGLTIYGPPLEVDRRAPTLSFTLQNATAAEVCKYLGQAGIYAWDGHFYAIRTTEVFGLDKIGGVTRMGMAIYNTEEEISRTVEVLKEFVD